MLRLDREALICDMAETYRIYDIKALPARQLAVLAVGLRDNARIKLKIAGMQAPLETLLMAAAVDRLGLLVWMQTKDGQRGSNRPASVVEALTKKEAPQGSIKVYQTAADFQAAYDKIHRKEENND